MSEKKPTFDGYKPKLEKGYKPLNEGYQPVVPGDRGYKPDVGGGYQPVNQGDKPAPKPPQPAPPKKP